MKMREFNAFFNKQYRDQPDGEYLLALQKLFVKKLVEVGGGAAMPEHVFYADDCFVVYRNLGFLRDAGFRGALEASGVDSVLMGRIWRIWVLVWSMRSRWGTSGAILDCGTYNGRALEVAIRYCEDVSGHRVDPIYACDMFEDPPSEARKAEHGPQLFEQVALRFATLNNAHVIKGALPQSLEHIDIPAVTWCQIDLNSATADAETFNALHDKLVDGAIVIFDDYGFSRYSETQERIDYICSRIGNAVLELPTGQGLYIHRC